MIQGINFKDKKGDFILIDKMNCPICSANAWHQTGIRKQKADDPRWKYGYPKFQKNVFFTIWHNNATTVEIKRLVCKKCGFVSDFPRPDEKEISEKYNYLINVEKDIGSVKDISKKTMKQEYKQAITILKLSKSYMNQKTKILNILDYGGGDGHFLLPMKDIGNKCFLIDYNKFPVSGIIRLGSTIEDIHAKYTFNLIICRHVLEHTPSPLKLITDLKNYLIKDGVIFAEVPIQLFGQLKPATDPVTHINFFQEESLKIMFEIAGYNTVVSRRISHLSWKTDDSCSNFS